MAWIIFGTAKRPIGVDIARMKCPSCEKEVDADIMVSGSYFHFFWIPFLPLNKEVNMICTECGLKRYELPFEATFIRNFKTIQSKFRHPWYSYLGISLVSLFVLSIFIEVLMLDN